jgi:tetratricopeptide (TPR) repeat protein
LTASVSLFLLFASPGSFDQLLRGGLGALNAGDLPAAQSQLEAATKADPRRPQAWMALAQTYFKLKKPQLANSAALNAESLGAADPIILRGLAFYYSETGNFDKAILLLQAALRIRPYEESYYFELSQQLLRMQKFEAALATLEAGVKVFDKSAQLELARGVALYGLRRFPGAIDAFLRTIQLAPEVEQPYVFLGRMLDVAEDKMPAITKVLATYAQSQPNSYMSGFLYAKALAAGGGNGDQIESLLRKSIALRNDFWESHFELGLALERKRAFDEAAKELERSIELSPTEPVPRYRLARVYDRLGKTAEANQQREIHARLSSRTSTEPRP